ncbi:serine/threonine-protein kinase EDR1-like isoform X1 [Nymphaea colorata]|nr:serine/threonine-protein kinase EDR1-like isoform X1 [Nymphaea colorata]
MARMKNIFRKLHIGGSHDTASRPDAIGSATASQSYGSDDRPSASSAGGVPRSPSPSSSPSLPSPAAAATLEGGGDDRRAASAASTRDFYSLEEEFQYQLALAISASNNDLGNDLDKEQIHAATLMSLGREPRAESLAEAQSRRYWDYDVLDYGDKVLDGFYDIVGISSDSTCRGKMPSLADLEAAEGDLGFEIVIVNQSIDPALEELEQISRCIAIDCHVNEVGLINSRLVQRIADLIVEHMGGPVKDANEMIARWVENSIRLRSSLNTSFLPIGCSNVGLSRHRALLFKVIADSVGIPCRLVKGSHYIGVDDGAVNIIRTEDGREFLVDLMGAPGALLPADAFSTNDPASNMGNSQLGKRLPPRDFQSPCINVTKSDLSGEEYKATNANGSAEGNATSEWKMASGTLPITPNSNTRIGITSSDSASSSKQMWNKETSAVDEVAKEKPNTASSPQDLGDSKQLFADLNPFQNLGTGKRLLQNKVNPYKVNDFHRHKENINIGPGRPPLAVPWKHNSNEVPKVKQQESVEGGFPRKNVVGKDFNASSSSLSSSSTNNIMPEFLNIHVPSVSNVSSSLNANGINDVKDDPRAGNVKPSVQVDVFSAQSAGNKPHDDGTYGPGSNMYQNTEVSKFRDYAWNANDKSDRRTDNSPQGHKMPLKERQISNSRRRASSSRLDPTFDDVAECEIPWEDLVIGERIGLGSYGEVYLAEWNGTEVAVKKFLDQEFSGDALQEFKTEVRIMRRLRHPNVVLFLGAVTRPPNLSIVTEFLPRGSLYKILHRPNCQIDEKCRIKMALDVAKGMNCLHTSVPTIVHRDLKSPNLLVDENWNVKVCDFGLSRMKHNTFLSSKSTAGTPEWMAPEVLRNEPSNEKCDVYSFGVILWELATLRMPWSGMNPMQVVGAVGFQNRRLEIPKEVDPLVARIIWECWQTDPNLRPSFAQLATALEPLQQLVMPNHQDSQSSHLSQEISVTSTP